MITSTTSVLGTRAPLYGQVLWQFYRLLIHFSFLLEGTDDASKQSLAASIVFFSAFHQLNGLHLSLSSSLCLSSSADERRSLSSFIILFVFIKKRGGLCSNVRAFRMLRNFVYDFRNSVNYFNGKTYWICINSLKKYRIQFSLHDVLYFTLKKLGSNKNISKNK